MTVRRAPDRGRPRTTARAIPHARPSQGYGHRASRRAPTSGATRHGALADLRRSLAAALSTALPGLGQLVNGRLRLAARLAVPFVVIAGLAWLIATTQGGPRLVAAVVSPGVMTALLAVNAIVLLWRLVAILHAFFDRRFTRRPTRVGWSVLAVLVIAAALPHAVLHSWGSSAQASFARIFAASEGTGPRPVAAQAPGDRDRLNILLVGVDTAPDRTATLTDTLMVVSVDPVGGTATIVSVPRDLVGVPLGDDRIYDPKLNSLLAYADRHPDRFPEGGMAALERAVGLLLGIPIHYYAQLDFAGFVKIVDAVGGVDVDVQRGFDDPTYDGRGVNPDGTQGWSVAAGPNHFNGWEALAYARARKAGGESDFTRAARQQEILLALKTRLLSSGELLTQLPALFDALGDLVTTDLPPARLPGLAALADELTADDIVRTVLRKPLVSGRSDPVFGSVQVPDLAAILEVAKGLFPPPGTAPTPWPAP